MEKLELKGGITFRFIRDNKVNKQGKVKIYLRFYRNGNKIKDHNTGIFCELNFFDTQREVILPRFEKDSEEQLNNLKLNHIKSILHRLDAEAYLSGRRNCLDDYLNIINGYSSSDDFVYFVNKNNNYEYNKDIIRYPTWRRHRSSLNRLTEFWGSDIIPIREITLDKIKEFDAYWRANKRKRNTIAGYHKDIKKQLNEALLKKMISRNPYDDFKFSYVDGDREALDQDELKRLLELYNKKSLNDTLQEVLRRFLFSCLTGLRISDTHVVTRGMIINNVLKFTPHKGNDYNKTVKLPLPKTALMLIEGREGKLFNSMSDQHCRHAIQFFHSVFQPFGP